MDRRRDALAGAAEFVLEVERLAHATHGLRATVGLLSAHPGAGNVVPGAATLSLDVRHKLDATREAAVAALFDRVAAIARRRSLAFRLDRLQHSPAVPADPALSALLESAVRASGVEPRRLASGAGHDAAIMASVAPMAMLFVRSPGGISHHPDERVLPADVALALDVLHRAVLTLADAENPGAPP
jgi:allantoate deiminase